MARAHYLRFVMLLRVDLRYSAFVGDGVIVTYSWPYRRNNIPALCPAHPKGERSARTARTLISSLYRSTIERSFDYLHTGSAVRFRGTYTSPICANEIRKANGR